MVDVSGLTERVETRADFGEGDPGEVEYWLTQEKIAEKEERAWLKKGRDISKRYRDERGAMTSSLHRFNIFWSNVQTLQPALYARTPKPDVERRFKDADPVGRLAAILLERSIAYSLDAYDFDDVMRAVVQDRLIPGRGVARVMYIPTYGQPIDPTEADDGENGDAAPGVVDNEGDEGQRAAEDDSELALAKSQVAPDPLREVVYEESKCKYVFWEDYREGPARVWEEVPWIRYRAYMTRAELIERFGSEKGKKVNLDYTPKGSAEQNSEKDAPPDVYKKAVVHEVWDKSTKKVVWYAPGTPDLVLDKQDDPLKLNGFFPNPNPLLSTTTTDKRIPVPDYHEYQDQARELDVLSQRIEKLVKALKVSGVYAGSEKQAIQQMLDEGMENKLVPVEDWAVFMDKGGLAGTILWLPIQQIAEVLVQLYNARDRAKQVLYEITGIADIVRGASNPNETATAQQIKGQFATLRLSDSQKAVAKFARELIRLTADVIAQHFSPQTISMITGYPQLQPVPPVPPPPQMPPPAMPMPGAPPVQAPMPPGAPGQPPAPQQPDPAMMAYQQAMGQYQQAAQAAQAVIMQNQQKQAEFDQAVQLIRQDAMHDFRIDIEADSTIVIDEQADKQARVEFMQQFVPLFQQLAPLVRGNPAMAALAKEVVLFAVRGFRVARTLEEVIEKAFDELAKMPPAPPQTGKGGTDPHVAALTAQVGMAKVQADSQAALQANAIKQQQVQGDLAIEQQRAQGEAAYHAGKLQIDQAGLELKQQGQAMEQVRLMRQSAQGLV